MLHKLSHNTYGASQILGALGLIELQIFILSRVQYEDLSLLNLHLVQVQAYWVY